MSNICYISAFYDTNRENWPTFSRTFKDYIDDFSPYLDLFNSDQDKEQYMILFIDKKYTTYIKNIIQNTPNTRIYLIEIDNDWMTINLPIWKTLEKERSIMQSQQYKDLICHRNHCPETYIPEYTIINHCKIDFVCYVIDNNLSTSDIFAWTDFGFFKNKTLIPKRLIDYRKVDINKVNFMLLNYFEENDKDIIYTLKNAPERIGGFFFCGGKECLKQYQKIYHNTLNFFQNDLKIADDDQAIVQACYFKEPSLFKLYHTEGLWHLSYIIFQK